VPEAFLENLLVYCEIAIRKTFLKVLAIGVQRLRFELLIDNTATILAGTARDFVSIG
jgi:hypothetical protein